MRINSFEVTAELQVSESGLLTDGRFETVP